MAFCNYNGCEVEIRISRRFNFFGNLGKCGTYLREFISLDLSILAFADAVTVVYYVPRERAIIEVEPVLKALEDHGFDFFDHLWNVSVPNDHFTCCTLLRYSPSPVSA